ncbi:MAG: hypothetical protein NTW07_03820, partial [candidate division Zixibacteria bacterium]|nr:hypothetical protein [candidate division Zixibacteria bacterium]
MSITIYSPLGATEKAYAISILYNGVYAGSPTDLGGLIGLKPVTMLSFIDANDISQNDWLGKIVSGTLTESLKAIYQDLDPTYAGLANIFVAAVLYNSGTPNWSLALAKSYVQTNAGIHYDDQAYPNDYLPFAILHTAIWAGSMAQNFRSGWTGSNPATPTGPFTYIICQQGASTNYYVADKLHRASTYNGDDTYAPTTDMVTMNWNGGTPGSFAEMRSFLSHRLSEHQQAPVMTTSPRKQDNLASPGNYPHIKKSASSQIIF